MLLVDDDAMLRRAVARWLKRTYAVTEAANGAIALALVQAGERFDCLVTDMNMPVLDGAALIHALILDAHPLAHRTVVLTASPESAHTALADLAFRIEVVAKPTSLEALDAAVRRVMEAR